MEDKAKMAILNEFLNNIKLEIITLRQAKELILYKTNCIESRPTPELDTVSNKQIESSDIVGQLSEIRNTLKCINQDFEYIVNRLNELIGN